jgi:hypothetical protein
MVEEPVFIYKRNISFYHYVNVWFNMSQVIKKNSQNISLEIWGPLTSDYKDYCLLGFSKI